MDKLLKVKSLKSWYGASQALFDVSLEVNQGEIVALLGRMEWGSQLLLNPFVVCINKYEGEIIVSKRKELKK